MTIILPSSPQPCDHTMRLISRRRDLEPTFNGPTSRVQRLGSRWAMDVQLPVMSYADAMAWIAALTAGDADTVLMNVPQPNVSTGAPGVPLVNGGGQTGKTLNVDGMTNGYALRAGQFLTIVTGVSRYLHMASAAGVVAGGAIAAAIEPMIRASPGNNAVVEIATPKIEGFLSGRTTEWTVDVARTVGLAFTITERA